MLERLQNAGWIVAFAALCAVWGYELMNASQKISSTRSHGYLDLPHPRKMRSCRNARAWQMVSRRCGDESASRVNYSTEPT